MTREIKFRAKSLETKKWVYGHYYAEIVFNDTSLDHFINTIPDYSNTVLVDPKTVGQFTGLKDMDGNEIYEGDVIKGEITRKEGIYVVTYEEGEYIGEALTEVPYRFAMYFNECKIIGNIHDNPELLSKEV